MCVCVCVCVCVCECMNACDRSNQSEETGDGDRGRLSHLSLLIVREIQGKLVHLSGAISVCFTKLR
jgi:hypothetical protein